MTSKSFDLADEAATIRLGQVLGTMVRPGDVLALFGTLGMGKSTLARALIQAQTSTDEEVPSPTFTLVQMYEGRDGELWHFDLYRLEKPDDAFELGIEDAFAAGISLIEWPERLGGLIPPERLDVTLSLGDNGGRRAILTSCRQWDERLGEITL